MAFEQHCIVDEVWRDVTDYEGLYEVSNLGQIRRGEKLKRPTPGKDRYLRVMLWKNNRHRLFLVHRLVTIVFLGAVPEGKEVNHINGNKADNRIANLEYVTRSENNLHAYRTGLREKQVGEEASRSILTEEQVLEARHLYKPHDKHFSAGALARKYGVDDSVMWRAISGKTWGHI